MGLEQLTILVESPGGTMEFDPSNPDTTIVAMFNPDKLTVARSVQWQNQSAAKRDNPEMQFTGADPATLTVELLFDTYDTPLPERAKQSVRDAYTDRLTHLTTVEQHGDKHRPPVCRLQWGSQGIFFQAVLQQLQIQFTMFTAGGTPVRATASCTFKQWMANTEDLQNQNLMSSDIAKVWVVKHGQSLPTIAAAEYGDPRAWPIIAEENGVDNPLALAPGTRLVLPPRPNALSPAAPR